MRTILIILGIMWNSPNTLIGIICALFGGTRFLGTDPTWNALIYVKEPGGLADKWMSGGGFFGMVKGGVGAYTIGQVIVLNKAEDYKYMIPHENRHVLQGLVLGPLHGPTYVIGCLVAWAQGKDPYRDCFLEVDAYNNS
jgi:hypothetical protein